MWKSGEHCLLSPFNVGVPQGTIIAPTLFNIYINDLAKDLGEKTTLFADDCTIICPRDRKTGRSDMDDYINRLENWCKRSYMEINYDKTVVLSIGLRKPISQIVCYIDGKHITNVNDTRILGVIFDSGLTRRPHIECMTIKVRRTLNFILRNYRLYSMQTKFYLVKMLVIPIITYCSNIWFNHSKSAENSINALMKYTTRIILNYFGRDACITAVMRTLNFPQWKNIFYIGN